MGNIFNEDFTDFLNALNNNRVDYILVGGYSVIIHGYNRTTGDMDIWVRKTLDNYTKLVAAFQEFKMPVFDMSEMNFLNNQELDVFSFGRPPVSIDIMTAVKGVDFEEAFSQSIIAEVDKITVRVIHMNQLVKAKKAANRFKDLDDLDNLKIM